MMDIETEASKTNAQGSLIKLCFVLLAHVPLAALIIWLAELQAKAGTTSPADPFVGLAMLVGLLHISFGLIATALRASARFLGDAEEAEDLRREGRALLLGGAALIAAGSSMVLLSLAGSQGVVTPAAALAGALLLSAAAMILSGIRLRFLDELNRALTKDANHLAFVWFSLIGGTWAIFAHLGFVAAPTPLGWLTMIWGSGFVAGMVALARKGGFDATS